jgi:flavodoxin
MSYQIILVTYLSVFPSKDKFTEKFAKIIAEKTGADLVEIESVKAYPGLSSEYPQIEAIAKQEKEADERPEIKNQIPVEDYDVIFVGYPIWWYTLPQIMFTFFDKYDLSGKTIIPFNTHEGSGDSGTYKTIKELEPDATVLKGLPIRGFDMAKDQTKVITDWIQGLAL